MMMFLARPALLATGVLLALVASGCSQESQKSCSSLLTSVPIPDTEIKTLTSSATGRNYDIYIRLPEDYSKNSWKKYPVLYVLDGQWDFKLLDSIYGGLHYDQFVPEMIIVGITYSGPSPDYDALRAKDYTPVKDSYVSGSGDAPKFLRFLKEELFSLIESTYRVEPAQRVLMGSSYGGLFTLYALFAEPELFMGYVAASPAVAFGNRAAFTQEADYARAHQELPVRLFVSVGELEPLASPVQQFVRVVSERNYDGLVMEMRTIEGERHAGNKPEAFNRGLRFIFQSQ